jgi:hypothetical protein
MTIFRAILIHVHVSNLHIYSHFTNDRKDSNTRIADGGFLYLWKIYSQTCSSDHVYRGRHGRDRMVVGFIPTCAISAYHH